MEQINLAIAIIHQAVQIPAIDGISKSMKPGGYGAVRIKRISLLLLQSVGTTLASKLNVAKKTVFLEKNL